MKLGNKIVLNEFKARLRKIVSSHPSQSIRFNQFMQLLTINNIRSYSKNQIAKINKFFDNPLKICRIEVPLSFFQLQCVQQCDRKKYFIIKVSSTQLNLCLYQIKDKKHNIARCLQTLTKILRRHYGSQKNWFKVLGGLTVAITIEPAVFKQSISKVLCNTSHSQCVDQLVALFIKDSKANIVQWKNFMRIINNQFLQIEVESIIQQKSSKISTKGYLTQSICDFQQITHKDKISRHQRKASLPISYERNVKSAYPRAILPKKKSEFARTFYQVQQQILQFPRSFSISAKQCVIYSKKKQLRTTTTSQKKNRNRIYHSLRAKTQNNFFDSKKLQQNQTHHFKTEYVEKLDEKIEGKNLLKQFQSQKNQPQIFQIIKIKEYQTQKTSRNVDESP